MQLCVFSKHFQDMDAGKLGKTLAGLGVPGVDLTVRHEGHVEPAKVAADLPKFADVLRGHGVKVTMLTTEITDAGAPDSRPVIEAAGKLGVKFIKLGYWGYRGFGHYREQEKEVRGALAALEPVLLANGVTAGFHVHSGNYMGLSANYIERLIADRDPRAVGVFYDIGHDTIEGSAGGWQMDLDLIRDRIVMVAVKNMLWKPGKRAENGRQTWAWEVVPLADGLADIPAFFGLLKKLSFAGPVSFHSEYELRGDPLVEQTRRDLAFARGLGLI